MKKIIVAGIGPGSREDITPAVIEAVRVADVVVGYKYYFQFVEQYLKPGCECVDTGILANTGGTVASVCIISYFCCNDTIIFVILQQI